MPKAAPPKKGKPELVEIGKVWKTRDRHNNPTLTGYTRADKDVLVQRQHRLLVLPNREPGRTDNAADFIVYYAMHGPIFDPSKEE
jgi:hypothetical protein